jgi:hypothetical protein
MLRLYFDYAQYRHSAQAQSFCWNDCYDLRSSAFGLDTKVLFLASSILLLLKSPLPPLMKICLQVEICGLRGSWLLRSSVFGLRSSYLILIFSPRSTVYSSGMFSWNFVSFLGSRVLLLASCYLILIFSPRSTVHGPRSTAAGR